MNKKLKKSIKRNLKRLIQYSTLFEQLELISSYLKLHL